MQAVDPPVVRRRDAPERRAHPLVPGFWHFVDAHLSLQERGLDLDAEDDVQRVGELVWGESERERNGERERERE